MVQGGVLEPANSFAHEQMIKSADAACTSTAAPPVARNVDQVAPQSVLHQRGCASTIMATGGIRGGDGCADRIWSGPTLIMQMAAGPAGILIVRGATLISRAVYRRADASALNCCYLCFGDDRATMTTTDKQNPDSGTDTQQFSGQPS